MNKQNYCCQLMTDFLEDKRIPLKYSAQYREYFFNLLNSNASQGILYCPWCGKKLPSRLGEKWLEILTKEYNISDPYDKKQSKLVPEEFKSDEWWKKRKL